MFESAASRELPSKRLTRVLAERRVNTDRVGRVLMLAGVRPPTALGPGSYHHEILVGLGATPAIAQGAPYVTLDAEDLLRLAPDVIILVQPRWGEAVGKADAAEVRRRLGKLGGLDLPAIRNGRLALLDDPMAFVPGSNLVKVAEEMGGILAEWSGPAKP